MNLKISIITVVYNDEVHIEETINSVINQTYVDIEYIIIDGGSSDNTLSIIESYKKSTAYFISEKDQGIYDAMNKGINQSTGAWILFLNSGDIFHDNGTIEKCVEYLIKSDDAKVIYGDVVVQSEEAGIRYNIKAKNITEILSGMVMNHQACFINARFHKNNLYNLKYKIASDYYFMLTSFL